MITGLSEMCSDYHYDLFYFSMYSMVSSLAVLISKYVSLNIYEFFPPALRGQSVFEIVYGSSLEQVLDPDFCRFYFG